MKYWLHHYRRVIVVAVHLSFIVVSYYSAFLLRFDGTIPAEQLTPFLASLPYLVAIRATSFWVFRLYEGLWRYVSLWDLKNIVLSIATSSALFTFVVRWPLHLAPYPHSVVVIDTLLLICLVGGVRFARRTIREFDRMREERTVLIYGAGDAGELIVRDIKDNRYYNCEPIGFIDDDRSKLGKTIHGVRVLGTGDDVAEIVATHHPHEVLIAMPSAQPAEVRAIVRSLERFKVPIKTLPNLRDVMDGTVEITQIRNLLPEDLMERKPIGLDPEPVRSLVKGRRILVTGAGGSIGSELTRQLAGFGPARLLLVERYENGLFEIANDLQRRYPGCACEPIVADITDAVRIDQVFRDTAPDVVFHAAAHKHVPLMERNASEAVKNNVRGTRLVAEAAAKYAVKEFVLISSDKAVNPSSVMGATKRVGELIIRWLARSSSTRFVAVRFGNVLDSTGSVTTIFAEQIKRGGPVTVTHPDIRRYFMSIPEAVQLVLHAAAMRDGDHVYALEMGEQIRILDLARNFIRLSGFVPDTEISIQFIGLRPGEKLFEELVEEEEVAESSEVPKIMRVRSRCASLDGFALRLSQLEVAGSEGRDSDVSHMLSEMIPTFRPPRAAIVNVGTVGTGVTLSVLGEKARGVGV
jgi:FlaA1/EpsC-like NDP-sugar epimerase